jgi:hypothetical protein
MRLHFILTISEFFDKAHRHTPGFRAKSNNILIIKNLQI